MTSTVQANAILTEAQIYHAAGRSVSLKRVFNGGSCLVLYRVLSFTAYERP